MGGFHRWAHFHKTTVVTMHCQKCWAMSLGNYDHLISYMTKMNRTYYSPLFAPYTPMYKVWVTFIVSGILQ